MAVQKAPKAIAKEAPSNWLAKVFKEIREGVSRIRPRAERRAERDAIIAEIKSHPNGRELAMHPELEAVVWEAIGVAIAAQREIDRNPGIMTASPDIHASWFVFDELGLPHPEPEF